jgi:hypothetical protein
MLSPMSLDSPTKQEVMDALGIKRNADLARFFGVTRGAVHFWRPDAPLPPAKLADLRRMRPDLFPTPAEVCPTCGQILRGNGHAPDR